MRLATKVAYNTIIQVGSKVVSVALGLLAIAFITRQLGQNGFGEYTTVMTFLSFFGIIADLGLTLVTVQIISQPGTDQNRALSNLLGLRLITALFFLALAPIAVIFFPYSASIRLGVLVASLSFFFIALNQIMVGLFQKELRMDKVAIAEVVNRVILLAGVVIAIKVNGGLLSILIATVAANGVGFLLHYIFARSFARIKLRFEIDYYKKIISKSWPLALTIFLNLIYLKADTLLLSIIKRPSEVGIIAEVGLYGAAYKVIDVVITFPFMFAGIILPIMTKFWSNKNTSDFKHTLQQSFNFMAIMAVPMIIGTQFVSVELMELIAGKEFIASGTILRLLILAAGFIFLGTMFAHAIIAIDKQKKMILVYLITAISSLIAYFVFIPKYSYFGAAWVTVYSEFIIALASAILIYKYTHFLPNWNVFIKSVLAAFVMALCLYITKDASLLFVKLPLAVVSYTFALYIFRGIKIRELKKLFSLK